MIRRLRRKFVALTMALVSVVLIAVFALLLISTYRQQRSDTMSALYRTMDQSSPQKPEIVRQDSGSGGFAPHDAGHGGAPDSSTVTFWVLADTSGTITDQDTESVDITSDTLEDITAEVLAGGKEQGILSNPDLRYLVRTTPDGTRIAFADRSSELSAMRLILLRLGLIGLCALGAFFGISVLLARIAVRPVEIAWEQQRQFLADASHELKTPLTVILANAGILAAHPQASVASQEKWLDGIQDEGGRMKKLIEDLLFLARADAARTPPVLTRVDFSDAVQSSALSFESVAYEKGVTLDTEVVPGLTVQGDAAQLRRLATILIDNACKYADGEKRVHLLLCPAGDFVRLRVENTGAAIAPEELPHLFERFYRTDRSRTQGKAGGFGLGLAIAASIVQTHHGTIQAQSENGLTSFTASIPAARGKGAAAQLSADTKISPKKQRPF
jgi:signal transduction histidine kinase